LEQNKKHPAGANSLGQRLRQARERLHWSQERLGEAIGTSARSINRWEHDKAVPQSYARQQLCRVLNLSPVVLFDGQEEKSSGTAPNAAIWYVPYRRNPFFTGREDVLTHLHGLLTSQRAAALTQSYALSGLGGIGKTQIALEYAHRYQQQYQAVFCLTADTSEALLTQSVRLADLLDLPEKDEQDQARCMQAVRRWLEDHTAWLLILDNADAPDVVRTVLPGSATGHILLTTRAQALGTIASSLEVRNMSLEEGGLLLLRRAKRLAIDLPFGCAPAAEREIAEAIVKEMDGLPLAIDQAGAYIEETGCSLSDYIALYHTRRADLLKRRGNLASDHPDSVATTLSLSFERVEQANAAAAQLLRLCAFLHADAIPEAILLAGGAELVTELQQLAADPLLWNEAIAALRSYSLVRRNAETKTLTMHRLVQEVLKDAMSRETYRKWAERAVRVVNQGLPEGEYASWATCQAYLPHVQICAILIERENMLFSEAARLLHHAGVYLQQRGSHTEAEGFLLKGQSIQEQVLGVEHSDTAQSLNDIAVLYHDQGKYVQAEQYYQQALAIRERVLGPEHHNTAESLHNLAVLYREQGLYVQAEPLARRALAIWEQVWGAEHPETAFGLNNLAMIYSKQELYAQAEPLLEKALFIREQRLTPDDHRIAKSLHNLADLYQKQGKYKQAETLHRRGLAIHEQSLGPEHPDTGRSFHLMALLYWDQGKYEEAEPFALRALTIHERNPGAAHPITRHMTCTLADIYHAQGKYEQAMPLYQRIQNTNKE
jgi:tetratricopeptide (TPR) repeat protein/transcriptional regulator with XRE-family HTH domain